MLTRTSIAVAALALLCACEPPPDEFGNGTPGSGFHPAGVVQVDSSNNDPGTAARVWTNGELKHDGGHFFIATSNDLVLANHLVAFTIRDANGGAAMYGTSAGHVVDAVRLQKNAGRDALREIALAVGMHVVKPTSFEKEEFEGGARVTVRGDLVPFPTLAEALGSSKPDVVVSHTYTLMDNSSVLEIATTIRSDAANPQSVLVADALFWSGDVRLFLPGHGSDGLPKSAQTDAFAVTPSTVGGQVPAYAFAADKKLSMINAGGIIGFLHSAVMPTKAGIVLKRWLSVGGYTHNDVAEALLAVRSARSSNADSDPVLASLTHSCTDCFIDALDAKGKPIARCDVVHGKRNCPLPFAAKSLRAGWIGNGDGMVGGEGQFYTGAPAAIQIGKTTIVDTPARGHLAVTAKTSGAGKEAAAIPFRITLHGDDGHKRTWVNATGSATFALPPGNYETWVHHGPFWTQHHAKIAIEAGKTVKLSAKLKKVVDTGKWLSADFHVHGEASSDSVVRSRYRMVSAVAEGVQYLVATDHDRLTDYAPFLVAKDADLTSKIVLAIGVEASTIHNGHFNVWPLQRDLNEAGFGAPHWSGKTIEAVMKELRGTGAKRIVQCNHPRFGDASVFDAINFDAAKTPASKIGCDVLEMLNGIAHKDTPQVLQDWLGLHKRGIRITATGTSDSHGRGDFIGNPRTLIRLESYTGKLAKQTPQRLDAALLQGRAVASAGPFLTIGAKAISTGTTAQIGDTLAAKGSVVIVTARVQSPDWMKLGRLKVYRNGIVVLDKALDKVKAVDQRHDVSVTLSDPATETEDSFWVAVHEPSHAKGNEPGLHRPNWAITNPVFVSRSK